MKKTLLFFVLLSCFVFSGYSQTVCPFCGKTLGQTINVMLSSSWNSRGDDLGFTMKLERGGYIGVYHNRITSVGNYGSYYINNNIVYITWHNGFQETIQLQYDSNGRIICTYKEYRLTEWDNR